MVRLLLPAALAALSSLHSAFAAPAATATCTTVTKTANYDDLPTGPIDPSLNYKGLTYSGFEIVRGRSTPFHPWTKPNLLKMTGREGTIYAAPGTKFNDVEQAAVSGAHNFRFGCGNATSSAACQFSKTYGVPCTAYGCTAGQLDRFDLIFNAKDYPHALETGIGAEGQNAPNVTIQLYSTPRNVHLYMDQYIYYVTNC